MGLLDDAIREHLDLKRRRGADPEEIERMQRDALGPVRRDPHAGADSSDSVFDDQGYNEADDERYADTAASAPEPRHSTADEPDAAFDEDDQGDYYDEHPTTVHQAAPTEEEHPSRRFGIFGRKHPKHEDEEPVEAEAHDLHDSDYDDDPFASDPYETTAEHEPAEHHEPREHAEYERPEQRPPSEPEPPHDPGYASHEQEDFEEAPPSPPKRPRFTDPASRRASEAEADDDRPARGHSAADDDAAHDDDPDDDVQMRAADTAEDAPRHSDDKTQLFEPDELEEERHEDEPGTSEHDVLEGTPDFLQDTPDHDRLWFEQKPPKDFDFGN